MAAVLLLLLLLLPLILLALRYRTRLPGPTRSLPRGSLGWPLLGETLEFISAAYSPKPESFMDRRRLLHGPVFKSHIFGSPAIVSTDPDFSRMVLQSDPRSFVPSYPKSLSELMGKSSILLINGPLHRRLHGLIAAFFKSSRLKSQITADMHSIVRRCMADWPDKTQPIFIQDQAKHIVFQTLVKGLIGLQPGDDTTFLKREFQQFIAGLMSIPIKLPGTRLYKSLQAKKRMSLFLKKIIEEKRKRNMKFGPIVNDVIDVLIGDNSGELTDELISENMIDLMIPAEDSVPVLVTLAIKYLSDSPLALQKLEEENLKLKESKSKQDEDLQWDDYMSLSFTQDVLTETLRLGNIIGGIMRKAVRDVEVKGHFIPKGWCVFTYFRSVHLDESIYDEPLCFNPWRWKEKGMSTCNFTPFGGGQRLCPGLDLARLEAAIFLHHFVTNFTWVAEEDQVVNFPTVRMKRGLPVRVTRKKEACELLPYTRADT